MKYSKLFPVLFIFPIKLGLLLFFPQTPASVSGKATPCGSSHCCYLKEQKLKKQRNAVAYKLQDADLKCVQKPVATGKRQVNTPISISIK